VPQTIRPGGDEGEGAVGPPEDARLRGGREAGVGLVDRADDAVEERGGSEDVR